MASMRPRSRIGCVQVVSWRSQARKSAQEMVTVSSAVAPDPEPGVGSGSEGGCRGGHEARPQRCWAAWRVMPSREPISAQE